MVKNQLVMAFVLSHMVNNAETLFQTDASNTGLGALLEQLQDGVERVIASANRTISKAEFNCSTTEKIVPLLHGRLQC